MMYCASRKVLPIIVYIHNKCIQYLNHFPLTSLTNALPPCSMFVYALSITCVHTPMPIIIVQVNVLYLLIISLSPNSKTFVRSMRQDLLQMAYAYLKSRQRTISKLFNLSKFRFMYLFILVTLENSSQRILPVGVIIFDRCQRKEEVILYLLGCSWSNYKHRLFLCDNVWFVCVEIDKRGNRIL